MITNGIEINSNYYNHKKYILCAGKAKSSIQPAVEIRGNKANCTPDQFYSIAP
jgi:hypothetical protein